MKKSARGWPRALSLTASLLSLWTAPAWAQNSEATHNTSEDGVWARGVPLEKRQRARALFLEGNKALEDSDYSEAARIYRQALQYWDHPAIHYNLALALKDFDQPTEIHQHLTAATRYGAEPLDPGKYNHALEYKQSLEQKLTWLDIDCSVPGAQVTLDGKPLFQAPNHFKGLVLPGVHSLVAVKPGMVYLDKEQALTMTAGGQMKKDLKLYPLNEVTQTRTRWAAWMPWSVMGSGLAVAAGGGLLHWQAHRAYSTLDSQVNDCKGCMPDAQLKALRIRGDTMQKAAVGGYALGGAGLLTGAVLLFLNQPRPYFVNPETGETTSLNFSPLLGNATGVQATLRH